MKAASCGLSSWSDAFGTVTRGNWQAKPRLKSSRSIGPLARLRWTMYRGRPNLEIEGPANLALEPSARWHHPHRGSAQSLAIPSWKQDVRAGSGRTVGSVV